MKFVLLWPCGHSMECTIPSLVDWYNISLPDVYLHRELFHCLDGCGAILRGLLPLLCDMCIDSLADAAGVTKERTLPGMGGAAPCMASALFLVWCPRCPGWSIDVAIFDERSVHDATCWSRIFFKCGAFAWRFNVKITPVKCCKALYGYFIYIYIFIHILSIYSTSFTQLRDKTHLHQGSKQESGKKVTDCFSSKCASVYPAMYLHCAFRQTSSHTAI